MREQLTKQDVEKIQKEIEYLKLFQRQERRAISVRILSTMLLKKIRIRMRAGSGIWSGC